MGSCRAIVAKREPICAVLWGAYGAGEDIKRLVRIENS
jgi:hypothetical protein